MIRFPKLAMAAALLAGASGLAFTPALAKKDDKKADAAAALKLSNEVRTPALAAQTALGANNPAAAEPSVAAVEAAAKSDDEKYIAATLRLQLEGQKEKQAIAAGAKVDETPLRAPLEALIASPRTTPEQRASFAFARGQMAFNAAQYPDAVVWLTKAKQFGSTDPQIDLALVKAKLESGDTAGGLAELNAKIDRMSAAGQKVPDEYYRYALSTSIKKGSRADALEWMKRWLTAYPSAENWHTALGFYGVDPKGMTKLDKQQLIDLYRLMRQTKSLSDQFYYEDYAQRVVDVGLPDEAKTVITEGRASGKVPAAGNSAAILADANKGIAGEGPLTTIEARAKTAPDGKTASQTADAYLGKGDYAKAVPLYQLALQKGGVKTDDVNTHLGIALAMTGDKAGAKAAFAAVTGAPRSEIAGFWSFWLDHPQAG